MHESNQAPGEPSDRAAGPFDPPGAPPETADPMPAAAPLDVSGMPIAPAAPSFPSPPSPAEIAAAEALAAETRTRERALVVWLGVVATAGVLSLALGMAELGVLAALAGVFAVAHAADRDRRFWLLNAALAWTIPVGCVIAFFSAAQAPLDAARDDWSARIALAIAIVGAAASLLAWAPRPADALARLFFRVPEPGHVLRLAARLVLASLVFSVPGWYLMAHSPDLFADDTLLGPASLWGGLIGMVLLSLGGVGWLVARDRGATLERLGIRPLRWTDAIVVVLGVALLFGINAGAESMQARFFPELWESDQRVNQMLAGRLSQSEALLLGISAGVGEEMAMRGALQPRLGLALTALLFAGLHVQYSWVGMGVIFAVGLVLGIVRRKTSTTTAILIHAIYDIVAVLTIPAAT